MLSKQGSLFLGALALFSVGSMHSRIVFSSIDTPGFYKLADNLTNSVTITVSDVTFDLGGHTIAASNGIIINSNLNQICIKNGAIDASVDGIIANSGCTNITLENITTKNATRGINFENVTAGTIKNCEMTTNTTGLELDNSHKINVIDCVASCNTHAGYCLLSSTTNCFENCKALSTGEANVDIDTTSVLGFVSRDGFANIFERCIANSTQALSVTGSSSVIAGFAFRGTEKCSKIVHSEASNSTTDPDGFTVPYGIFIEGTFDSLGSVTGVALSGPVAGVNWSPDGQYLAVGGDTITGGTGDDFQIFRFDRVGILTSIVGVLSGTVNDVNWSPDGQYLAVGGATITGGTDDEFQIFAFDRVAGTLTSVAGALSGTVNEVKWSPDGQYVAVGGVSITGGTGDDFQIFRFDRAAGTVTSITGVLSGTVNDVDWSPDGLYLAVVGQTITGGTGDEFQIFRFDRAAGILTSITGVFSGASIVQGVDWSPDGLYLAVVGSAITGGTGNDFQIFRFDRAAGTLISITGVLSSGSVVDADWSADGQFVAVVGTALTGDEFQIFRFDRAAGTLTSIAGALSGSPNQVNWSPDGQFIAVGGGVITGGTGDEFQILDGLQFPEKNVIKDNVVYCNSGNQFPGGVGISGSSIANMIIGNTSYSNPLPRAENEPIVSSNYQFVTNVFNPLFGIAPSDIQNISLDGCAPICQPDDVESRLRRIEFLTESLIDNLL